MPTQLQIREERALLAGLGLQPVKIWPPRCKWLSPDGTLFGILPADEYSRLRYLARGLRPIVATPLPEPPTVPDGSLLGAISWLLDSRGVWEGTATELLQELNGTTEELPTGAICLSSMLNKLSSQMIAHGFTMERMTRGRSRAFRLRRLQQGLAL